SLVVSGPVVSSRLQCQLAIASIPPFPTMSDGASVPSNAEGARMAPASELLPLVYEELRKLAAHKLANEAPGQTLQPTALVHEAWLRLAGKTDSQWQNRAHFLAAAADAMRHILVDKARRKQRVRHGGGLQ